MVNATTSPVPLFVSVSTTLLLGTTSLVSVVLMAACSSTTLKSTSPQITVYKRGEQRVLKS